MAPRLSEGKTLLLLRHAHRDKPHGSAYDNGLSGKGHRQAANIARRFHKSFDDERPLVLTSPKLRCIETVLPIVDGDEHQLERRGELDEGGSVEAKAKAFAKWWKSQGPSLTVACSHGDVLPELVEQLTGARVELKKGGWVEIRLDDSGAPLLYELIQKP